MCPAQCVPMRHKCQGTAFSRAEKSTKKILPHAVGQRAAQRSANKNSQALLKGMKGNRRIERLAMPGLLQLLLSIFSAGQKPPLLTSMKKEALRDTFCKKYFCLIFNSLQARRQRLIIFGQFVVLKLKRVLLAPLAHPDRRE